MFPDHYFLLNIFSFPRRKSSDLTAELDNLSLKVEKFISEVLHFFCLKCLCIQLNPMLFFDGYIYVLLLVLHDKWNFHFCTYQSSHLYLPKRTNHGCLFRTREISPLLKRPQNLSILWRK